MFGDRFLKKKIKDRQRYCRFNYQHADKNKISPFFFGINFHCMHGFYPCKMREC
jgi:hypothetical protein